MYVLCDDYISLNITYEIFRLWIEGTDNYLTNLNIFIKLHFIKLNT